MTLTPAERARALRAAADWCEALADDPSASPGGWHGQGGTTVEYNSKDGYTMGGGCALGYAAWAAAGYPDKVTEICKLGGFDTLSTCSIDRVLSGNEFESSGDWYMSDVVTAFDGSGIGKGREVVNSHSLRVCATALRAHADRIAPAETAIPVIESRELVPA